MIVIIMEIILFADYLAMRKRMDRLQQRLESLIIRRRLERFSNWGVGREP
jgi:hypothetical protein